LCGGGGDDDGDDGDGDGDDEEVTAMDCVCTVVGRDCIFGCKSKSRGTSQVLWPRRALTDDRASIGAFPMNSCVRPDIRLPVVGMMVGLCGCIALLSPLSRLPSAVCPPLFVCCLLPRLLSRVGVCGVVWVLSLCCVMLS
jgi:hypothetical protein